jgi:hypothetical protein
VHTSHVTILPMYSDSDWTTPSLAHAPDRVWSALAVVTRALARTEHTALPATAQWVRARLCTDTTQHWAGPAAAAAHLPSPVCRSARSAEHATRSAEHAAAGGGGGGGALAMSRLSDGTHLIPSST